ncbi:MAG: hypothetical protein LUG85_08010 [Clostridiales bacterium]|nr:hypothetical protein [Clostridiales bacterium]
MNNIDFYKGFEGEPKIELKIIEDSNLALHIWDGYFCDIFSNPVFHEKGRTGFTKDYQEGVRTYDNEGTLINIPEYLSDLRTYRGNRFEIAETSKCLDLICDFLEYAEKQNYTVLVSRQC